MNKWKRIVVKVGTSTLCYPGGRLNIRRVEKLVKVLSDIRNSGREIMLVSSGAIAMGVGKLRLDKRPQDMAGKQAAAAVGQCELMYIYDKMFSEYNHNVAQILLTGDDLRNPDRRHNFENTLFRLLDLGAIPILNENDTMSTDEISSIGDNDSLAAHVAVITKTDLLVLLSDIDGLYTDDPHRNPDARIIHHVSQLNDEITSLAQGPGSAQGTGGMVTKLHAAKLCMDNDIDMIITNGQDPQILYDIMDRQNVGTLFSKEDV